MKKAKCCSAAILHLRLKDFALQESLPSSRGRLPIHPAVRTPAFLPRLPHPSLAEPPCHCPCAVGRSRPSFPARSPSFSGAFPLLCCVACASQRLFASDAAALSLPCSRPLSPPPLFSL